MTGMKAGNLEVYTARTYSFIMAELRLQAELVESKAEIQRLRERMSIGTPTVHREMFFISLVPKWSGSETVVPLEEFSSIEGSARVGRC